MKDILESIIYVVMYVWKLYDTELDRMTRMIDDGRTSSTVGAITLGLLLFWPYMLLFIYIVQKLLWMVFA